MDILHKDRAPKYERDNIISYLLVSERTCGSKRLTTTIVEMLPGGIQRVHSHEQEQMYYILEGKGHVTAGDQVGSVHAGDSIFFPSNTPHGMENIGISVLRYLSAAAPSFGREESEILWPLNAPKSD